MHIKAVMQESVYSDKAEQAFQPTYLEGLQVSPEQQRSLFDIGFDLKAMQSVHSLEDHNQQEALESARSCPSMTTHGSRIVQVSLNTLPHVVRP